MINLKVISLSVLVYAVMYIPALVLLMYYESTPEFSLFVGLILGIVWKLVFDYLWENYDG